MKKTGDIIKKLREKAGLSQEELAADVCCSSKSIYRYEKNTTLIDTNNLINLALYFGVTTDYLLGLNNSKNNIVTEDNKSYLYDIISKSRNNIPLINKSYYWISKYDDTIAGQTAWTRFTDNGREERTLRKVIPDKAIKICTNTKGKPMVINTGYEAIAFSIIGGEAIIDTSICEKYLPEFFEPFIV